MGTSKKTTSKNFPVKLSVTALQNIDEITGYISFINQQPLNAIKVGDAIFNTIDRIAIHPFAFKNVKNLKLKQKYTEEQYVFPGLLFLE